MNNNLEQMKIKAKLDSNRILLLATWLVLIILPYLSINFLSETFLADSEKRILLKIKSQLINEVYDYQKKLSTDFFIENKLSNFPNAEMPSDRFSAEFLAESLNRHLRTEIAAMFYFCETKDNLEAYIRPDLKSELGMYSRKSIKSYMECLVSKITDSKQVERYTTYFQQLLLAAGGVTMLPEHATPILSGKSELQRMTGFFKSFRTKDNNQHYFLFLIRNQDISNHEIIKLASQKTSGDSFSRNIIYTSEEENRLFKYESNPEYGLSIYAMPSEDIIIRYITNNTYYPYNCKRAYNKFKKEPSEKEQDNKKPNITPQIRITAPTYLLQHPMRETINSLRFPMLLLVLMASFLLINIAIFGYAGSVRILSRVIICISAAVLIPFTSFGLAAFYNHYYTEEYNKNEIQQYTEIQLSVIEKAVEAFLNNRELAISKLRTSIINLSQENLEKKLWEWLPTSNATLVSYCYDKSKEIIIKKPEDPNLSQLSRDAKLIANFGLRQAFQEFDFSNIYRYQDLEHFLQFSPEGMGKIIVSIGKIYNLVSAEPNALYSIFPIFEKQNDKITPLGSVLVKFDCDRILAQIKKRMSTIFSEKHMGNYTIKTAIIPLTDDGLLTSKDKMFLSENFPLEKVMEKAKQIAHNKAKHTWETENTINSGNFITKINSVILSVAELSDSKDSANTLDIQNILIYTVLLILALSLVLCGIIITPLKQLKNAAEKVGEGDYTNKVDWKSRDEFETLGSAFNEMTDALLQKEKMSNYVSTDVLNEISNSDLQLQPGGERIPVSILFCAVKGEKELSQYPVETITTVISMIVDTIDELATANYGQIDKLIEDTVMVVFRKTPNSDDLAINACRTALAINNRLKQQLPGFKLIMGIASGDAVSGKIGSRNGKLDYTVIGNPVNLAARLKVQAVKAKNTGILVCPYTIRLLQGAGKLQFIERLTIKGRTNRTFPLYELLTLRES